MQGNIIHVDYERSSWRYMNCEYKFQKEDLEAFKIGGASYKVCDTIEPYLIGKGGGSAYGGNWKPNPDKPNEVILQGPPNTIQCYFLSTKNGGYRVQVKYGNDGWAVKIRHETTHYPNQDHTNPHDHNISYDPKTHFPIYDSPQINYPADQFPNGAPEFKSRSFKMDKMFSYNAEAWRFKTINEFKASLYRGGEIVIEWKGEKYGIFNDGKKFYIVTPSMHSIYFNTPDDLLTFIIDDDRLRDIITQVTVLDRTI